MSKQIRVYVKDETYKNLTKIAEKTGETIGQAAGNILDEKVNLEEFLNDIFYSLKFNVESLEKSEKNDKQIINYLKKYDKMFFKSLEYIFYNIIDMQQRLKDDRQTSVNQNNVYKKMVQAIDEIKKTEEE